MAIINNNVTNVKFLRNGSVFNNHNAAYAALTEFELTNEQDGTAILARYTATDGNVKTLVGWVYVSSDGNTKYVTIQDVEGASSDIMALLGGGITTANTVTDQLEQLSGDTASTSADTSVEGAKRYADDLISTLDGGVTAETGYYVKSVSEVDGKISGTTEALPSVEAISENGKAITAVSESNGEISATAGTIDAQYVDVTGFTATDVQGALEEVKNNIGEAISGLDYSDSAVAGEYVSQVSETDGVISVTRVALPSYTDTAVTKQFVAAVDETNGEISVTRGEIQSSGKTVVLTADGNDVNFEVNIDGETLQKDENGVISVTSSALVQYEGDDDTIQISAVQDGKRTVSSPLTIQKVTTGLSEEVKEEYHLVGHSGTTIGDPVKIYKDSHIVSINYITDSSDPHYQNLEYVYLDASGDTKTTYVDMSELVIEAEFASGVTVTDGVAHGVVDPTSETFLTVGSDGFKLSGVQDAIDSAVSGLDASVSAETTHITVKVDEVDGKLTVVTLTEDDIASATALTKEISDRESGDTELSNRIGTGVTTANTATAQLTALSGNNESTSADTSVEGAKRYADAKLADAVSDLDATVTAATSGNHITISIEELDGKLVQSGLTIAEDNIANADDLAELSGKTITAITSTNGSITASIDDAVGCKTYDIETDASKIKMSGFTSTDILSGITPASSVTEAFMSLDDIISENERVTAAALTDLDERVDEVSGKVDTIESQYVSGVSVNGNAVTIANHVAPISVSAATSATTASTANAIVVDTDANGNITLGLNYIDCGFYE